MDDKLKEIIHYVIKQGKESQPVYIKYPINREDRQGRSEIVII